MENIIHWSKMTTLIDERLSELDKGSEMYEQLVRAREQYALLIANAR